MRQEIEFFCKKLLLESTSHGKLLLLTSYLGCQRSHPLVIVASREPEDTPSCLVSGGISLSPKQSSSTPSYISKTTRIDSSS